MTDDDWGIHPTRREPRGEFPLHSDRPRAVMTREAAKRYAAQRLAAWLADHPTAEGGDRGRR